MHLHDYVTREMHTLLQTRRKWDMSEYWCKGGLASHFQVKRITEGLSFFPVYQKLLCKWLWPRKGKLAKKFKWACFYAPLLPQCVLGVCWTTMLKVCHRGTIWIRQWHWTTITTVGRLLLSPQHIGPTSGCCKFITPNTLAIPPNRVKS